MALEIINDATKASSKLFHVEFILDETGSMASSWQSTIDGFNEYVNGLRQDKENNYRLSLVKFDVRGDDPQKNVRSVFVDTPINDAPLLDAASYTPGGMTNLNDAIGMSITRLENRLSNEDINVLVIILTDGCENASKEWKDPKNISDLIERKKKDGWTVTFLGANIDVQSVGKAYSIDASNIKAYSTNNMGGMMRGLASATSVYAASCSMNDSTSAATDFFEGTSDWTDSCGNTNKTVASSGLAYNGVSRSFTIGTAGLCATTIPDASLVDDTKLKNKKGD